MMYIRMVVLKNAEINLLVLTPHINKCHPRRDDTCTFNC